MKNVFGHLPSRLRIAFAQRAGLASGFGFGLGNALLFGKGFIDDAPSNPAEQAAGLGFLLGNIVLMTSDQHPKRKKVCGMLFLLSTTALGYAGIGLPGQNAQLVASTITGLMGAALVFEDKLNALAQHMADKGKGLLSKVFTPLAKRPVMTTSSIDLFGSTVPLAFAAAARDDRLLLLAAGFWTIGNLALMAADTNVNRALTTVSETGQAPQAPHQGNLKTRP